MSSPMAWVPAALVPMWLPCTTLSSELVIRTPLALTEMRSRAPGVVPPIVLQSERLSSTPLPALIMDWVPE